MGTRLTLRAQTPDGTVERSFTRTPVFMGRKAGNGQFDFEDRRASKLHASIDLHQGRYLLRDAASTNGTFWNGARLEPDEWTDVGPTSGPVEFQIGGTVLTAWTTFEADLTGVLGPGTLGGLRSSMLTGSDPGSPVSKQTLDTTARGAPAAQTQVENETVARGGRAFDPEAAELRLTAACHDASTSSLTLERVLRQELESAPADARLAVCNRLLQAHPELTRNRRATDLFGHYGVDTTTMRDPPSTVVYMAYEALQDLAVWYTGESRRLERPEHVAEFHYRLRTALDDLMLGYAQLLSGLNRFESQMSLRRTAMNPGAPLTAADLASRLLDWQTDNQAIRDQLRASFAELTMHQVALLRGVMRGVGSLLAELSPDVIEGAAEAESSRQGVRRMFARPDPWATYKRRYSDLSDEENERFRLLFGADFVSEYRQFQSEARAESAGSGEPPHDPEPR
jgi:hypothetical protein